MKWPIFALALATGAACAPIPEQTLSPEHARAMSDSVAAFLRSHAAFQSAWSGGDGARDIYSDSVVAMADVLPDAPLVIHGLDALAGGGGSRPTWMREFAFVYDSATIVPLAPGIASVAAIYRETITDTSGQVTSFRAMAHVVLRHEPAGWRIRMFTSSHPDSASAAYHRLETRFASPSP